MKNLLIAALVVFSLASSCKKDNNNNEQQNVSALYYWADAEKRTLYQDYTTLIVYSTDSLDYSIYGNSYVDQFFDNEEYIAIIKLPGNDTSFAYQLNNSAITGKYYGVKRAIEGQPFWLSNTLVAKMKDGENIDAIAPIIEKYNGIVISTEYDYILIKTNVEKVLDCANEIYENGKVKFSYPNFIGSKINGMKRIMLLIL